MKEKCKDCEFFKYYDGLVGECVRYPPMILCHPNPDDRLLNPFATEFPEVDENMWCGEFKRKALDPKGSA
jgi:hypothetical protein